MTTKQKKSEEDEELVDVPHEGSLFFPLPNGTALLYKMKGISTEPESEGKIEQTMIAKKTKNFIIPVKNWSKNIQRFSASWEVEGNEDPSVFIRGANTFDVAGGVTKDYKMNFLSLRTGVYKYKVTFKAKETGEYVFFNVQITVEENSEVEHIELVS